MKKNKSDYFSPSGKLEQGATLFTVMIVMLAATIIALVMYQSVIMQYRVARSQEDHVYAMQLAEAALADARMEITCKFFDEAVPRTCNNAGSQCREWCRNGSSVKQRQLTYAADAKGKAVCQAGFCQNAADSLAVTPMTKDNSSIVGAWTGNTLIENVPGLKSINDNDKDSPLLPRYMIEAFKDKEDPQITFRITAEAKGRSASTVVRLQEVLRPVD